MTPVRQIFDFYLTEDERTSGVWTSLKDRLERKLAELRVKNDDPTLTDVETATLRGHIECLKGVISLGREPPPKVATVARPPPRTDLGERYG